MTEIRLSDDQIEINTLCHGMRVQGHFVEKRAEAVFVSVGRDGHRVFTYWRASRPRGVAGPWFVDARRSFGATWVEVGQADSFVEAVRVLDTHVTVGGGRDIPAQ